jgi:hypothetical protein
MFILGKLNIISPTTKPFLGEVGTRERAGQ